VAVEGGGVAGCVLATFLARAGLRVVQYVAPLRQRVTPCEILSPATRGLLRRLALPEPQPVAICAGVLSCWGSGEPDYQDYRLMLASDGLAIRREDLRDALLATAARAGVVQRRVWAQRREGGSRAGSDTSRYRVVARGRARNPEEAGIDRLVALCMPIEGAPRDQRLLVEAIADGWWYRPPAAAAHAMLAFVTDPALVPRGGAARATWLARNFHAATLVRDRSGTPHWQTVSGMDARVGQVGEVIFEGGACVGDAALSIDPLSGTGIALALQGAAQLAVDIMKHGEASGRYRQWLDAAHAQESAMRAGLYARVAEQFPDAPFWRRIEAKPAPRSPRDDHERPIDGRVTTRGLSAIGEASHGRRTHQSDLKVARHGALSEGRFGRVEPRHGACRSEALSALLFGQKIIIPAAVTVDCAAFVELSDVTIVRSAEYRMKMRGDCDGEMYQPSCVALEQRFGTPAGSAAMSPSSTTIAAPSRSRPRVVSISSRSAVATVRRNARHFASTPLFNKRWDEARTRSGSCADRTPPFCSEFSPRAQFSGKPTLVTVALLPGT
jgi:2-polyprenyl-6-methoxyphenol hydroxylase-like FAD-dependent oxidoreductase